MKTLELYQKTLGLKAAQGAEVTPEILAKINKYALTVLTADEVFVRKYLMAHNAVDRDNERFSEKILDDFGNTLPGKSLLNGHDRQSLPIGLYFDANTEELTKEQFTSLTGEEARLPDGIEKCKVLWGWVYMLKAQFNEKMIANIDAGIYRHASIGFRATDITPVKGQYENILFWEYVSPGEALEGSIVWLGAQPGATALKHPTHPPLAKGRSEEGFEKGAVSFSPTTPADEGRAWDASAATARLAKWASSDGSGDKDKMDWPKYRKGFAWFDADNPENFGSYKLPHHDVIDDEINVLWSGVSAAMGVLLGARGGVDIPDSDFDRVYSHLARHYDQFDREVPEKSYNQGGNKKMKDLLEKLAKKFSKTFTEDNIVDEIQAMLAEKDKTISEKDARINELSPLAEDGKTWRDGLIADYVKLKAKLGEVAETPEGQEPLKKVAQGYPIDFLKTEVAHLQKRVDEKFPAEAQTKGDERRDKTADGGGEKDYTKDNPLTPEKKEDK